jgi:osmoprotectant transport system permease protein
MTPSFALCLLLIAAPDIVVGSKADVEGNILGEMFARVLEEAGEAPVVRKFALGGTGIVMEALQAGSLTIYPEYTSGLSHFYLQRPDLVELPALTAALADKGLLLFAPLGFNNTYGVAVRNNDSNAAALQSIQDLAQAPTLRAAFSAEFADIAEGYPGLQKRYGLAFTDVRTIEHNLAYDALLSAKADIIDVYTTDARAADSRVRILDDKDGFFPSYLAAALTRADFATLYPRSTTALRALSGSISEDRMRQANKLVELDGKTPAEAAAFLLNKSPPVSAPSTFWRLLFEHVWLMLTAVLAAVAVGIPAGIVAADRKNVGAVIVGVVAVVQTIPALALLVLLVPLLGLGGWPAFVALFLYGLLPVVRGVVDGLRAIDPKLLDVAAVLGLPWSTTLWRVRLPLALPTIAAGVKTTAVVSVGTATLAALVGGGGFGSLIMSGLSLNQPETMLRGAVPVCVLAVVVEVALSWLFRSRRPLAKST